jgi:hypothetical protein
MTYDTYDEVKELIDSLRQDATTAREALMTIADKVREIGAGPQINPETLNLDIANLQDAINELADLLDTALGSREAYVAGRREYDREVARN